VKCVSVQQPTAPPRSRGRRAALISSAIPAKRGEIEAQLVVNMLVLDTAADAIIERAVTHQSI